jgi:hypothetical protein
VQLRGPKEGKNQKPPELQKNYNTQVAMLQASRYCVNTNGGAVQWARDEQLNQGIREKNNPEAVQP